MQSINLKNVENTFIFLVQVYLKSKNGCDLNDIEFSKLDAPEYSQEMVIKYGLVKFKGGVMLWKTIKPCFELAFDYYCTVRNNKTRYSDVLKMSKNAGNLSPKAIGFLSNVECLAEELDIHV